MTIHQVSTQLHDLSVAGYFNGEKFSRRRLKDYITRMFRAGGTRLVMEIALPDGRWYFTVNRFSPAPDGFDYTIPDTREEEAEIIGTLH